MKAPIRFAAVAAVSVFALMGCGDSNNTPGSDQTDAGPASDPVFEGRWVAEDPEDAFLEFSVVDDNGGTMTGSDGCNGVQGEFHIDGDTAEIKRGLGTLKGCPGVDTWLRGVTVVVIDGDTMSVQDEDGDELGVLTREDDSDDAAPSPSGNATASLDEASEEADNDADSDADSDDDSGDGGDGGADN